MSVPCRFFAAGHCANGASCPFSHGAVRGGRAPVEKAVPSLTGAQHALKGADSSLSVMTVSSSTTITECAAQKDITEPARLRADKSKTSAHSSSLTGSESDLYAPVASGARCDAPHPMSYAAALHVFANSTCRDAGSHSNATSAQDKPSASVAPTPEETETSKNLACGVCLEIVRPKGMFGILSSCDHVICLSCIRTWRASHAVSTDVARSCPECRTPSHYVIPSVFVPIGAPRKRMLEEGYLRRLRKLPCKHFNFGDGTCPFGSSCFYAHVDRLGCTIRPEPPRRVLMQGGAGRGQALPTYRLSDFLFPEDMSARDVLDEIPIQSLSLP